MADSDGNSEHGVPVVYEPVEVDTVAEEPDSWIGNTPTPDLDSTPSPRY